MKRKTREEKAITLIALIITIVVLLILAVVAINAVTGDGIIQHATNAKTDYEEAQALENNVIASYEKYLYDHDITRNKMIKFSIIISDMGAKIEYIAEEGMTWREFLKSEYNVETTYKFDGLEHKFTLTGSESSILLNILFEYGSATGTLIEIDGTTKVNLDTVITNGKQCQSDNLIVE